MLRRITSDKSPAALRAIAFKGVRGDEGVKEAEVAYGDRTLKIAVVSGLGNARKIIERIKAGEHYDFVEVMACPGGCVCGAGQPFALRDEKELRGNLLKGKVHELLHVHYGAKEAE